ncbi:MAG: class I SAM-dependent RNA methyltransferase [Candidatus Marinimicrobia bacterium]|nr:class I SAM-dependent RNA methyltransferase [Candidatus Neomarinimicrobiota bacterium]
MYLYQKQRRYFAQVTGGLEELAIDELKELGGYGFQPSYRGVFFCAESKNLYKIVYKSRIITRVLAPLVQFKISDDKTLYGKAKSIRWSDFLNQSRSFRIFANIAHSEIKHSQYAAQVLKDAIVDQLREKTGERPSVDLKSPDVVINLYIHNNKATISLDLSGESLHKRKYRKINTIAPMQETLAAAIVRAAKWDGETPLYDPMCGSGTILCEALMHYCKIPAAHYKDKFGFMYLPEYHEEDWLFVKKLADDQIRELPQNLVFGSDSSPEAIKAAGENLNTFYQGISVNLKVSPFQNLKNLSNYTIMTNPPYGYRMGNESELQLTYKIFGDFLKNECKNSLAYVYCGNRELIKFIGLRTSFKMPMKNGDLDGRLLKFELY